MARVTFNGNPDEVFTNTTGSVLFQFICNWKNTCGLCGQYDHAVGPHWPIPLHRGCRCTQRVVPPGHEALPFIDFRERIAELDHAQQSVVVGRANLILIERGIVPWSDVVTRTRVRDFREVVALKKLSVDQMIRAGVNRHQAEKAHATVHMPAHIHAEQHRKSLVDHLIAKGVSKDQIKESFGERIAGRVGITRPPIKPPAEISPVVAKILGVKPEVVPSTPPDAIREAVAYAKANRVKVMPAGRVMMERVAGVEAAKRMPAAFLHAGDQQFIAINQDHPYWKDPQGYMDRAAKQGFLGTDKPDHPIVHEVGHAKHYESVGRDAYRAARDRMFTDDERKMIAEHVSRYAAKDRSELVAEVYAGRQLGKRYGDEVMRLYREAGGPAEPRLYAPAREGSKTGVKKPKVESPPSYHPDFHAPLPDIKAKLDAYTEGDRKVKALADAAAPAREVRAKYDRVLNRVNRLYEAERQATPEELKTIRAERQFAQEDLRKLNGQLQDAERKHRAIAMEIIGVEKGVSFTDVYGTLDKKLNQSFRDSAEGAMTYLGKVIASTDHPINLEWERSSVGRAYSGGTSIGMGKDDPASTAVHELGHVLEYTVPGWHEAAQAYLKHRVGDEKNTSLRDIFGDGYRVDEKGRKDRFDMAFDERLAYYVGKDYGVTGTEITAMGIEKLFRDPLNFAASDPEYVKFLLGMMDGALR